MTLIAIVFWRYIMATASFDKVFVVTDKSSIEKFNRDNVAS